MLRNRMYSANEQHKVVNPLTATTPVFQGYRVNQCFLHCIKNYHRILSEDDSSLPFVSNGESGKDILVLSG